MQPCRKDTANPTGFLGMLYDNSMQRIPDSSGLNYWNEQLTGGVFGANQVVEHFLFSDEIGAKVAAMSSEEYRKLTYSSLCLLYTSPSPRDS